MEPQEDHTFLSRLSPLIVRFVKISEVEVILLVVDSVNSSQQSPVFFFIFSVICYKKFALNAAAVCRH